MSAMMYAAQHGHVAIVQALLREKASTDLGDKVPVVLERLILEF
jgi:ankyrin repeat protein